MQMVQYILLSHPQLIVCMVLLRAAPERLPLGAASVHRVESREVLLILVELVLELHTSAGTSERVHDHRDGQSRAQQHNGGLSLQHD